MDKSLSQLQVKSIIDNAPKGSDQKKIIEGLVGRGYTLEGLNDQKKEAPSLTSQPDSFASGVMNVGKDLAIGAGKGLVNTAQTVASPITGLMNKAIPGSASGFSDTELKPTNTAQSIGKGIEQVAEFAAPGTAGLKVAKVPGLVNLAARMGTEALGGGAVTLAQTGSMDEAKQGGLISAAFPAVGKTVDMIKSEKNAGRIINSLIKTKLNDLSFGKNPGKTVAELGITGNSLDDLGHNISLKTQEIGTSIGNILDAATAEGKTTNISSAFAPLDDAIAKAKKAELSNAPLITKLENLRTDLTKGKNLTDISPNEAFEIKKNVSELTKFTGNPSDDKTTNAALISIYGNIKKAINTSVDNPELAKLNDHYGNLVTANKAVNKRIDAVQGQNLVSLGGKTVGTGVGLLTLLSGGAAVPAFLTGLAVAGGEKAISSPAVKTRVAKWLANKSVDERKEVFKAAPYLKGLIITNTVE